MLKDGVTICSIPVRNRESIRDVASRVPTAIFSEQQTANSEQVGTRLGTSRSRQAMLPGCGRGKPRPYRPTSNVANRPPFGTCHGASLPKRQHIIHPGCGAPRPYRPESKSGLTHTVASAPMGFSNSFLFDLLIRTSSRRPPGHCRSCNRHRRQRPWSSPGCNEPAQMRSRSGCRLRPVPGQSQQS